MANIGLTGRIACGKSTVLNMLKCEGFEAIDADKIAHELHNRPDVSAGIRNAFGDDVFDDGIVSRKKLGQLVFKNEDAMDMLQSIMRPRIFSEIFNRLNTGKSDKVVESYSIIDTEIEDWVDEVWTVDCPYLIQKSRLMARNPHLSEEDVNLRIAAQPSREHYILGADVIIDTSKHLLKVRNDIRFEIARITYGRP